MATIAVSPEALWAVDVGFWLIVGSLEVSVTVELGMDVVGTVSGSVPVATIAVSPVAISAVEVGSWLTSVVGLGLIRLEEDIVEGIVVWAVALASGTGASDSSPAPEPSCRLIWRT